MLCRKIFDLNFKMASVPIIIPVLIVIIITIAIGLSIFHILKKFFGLPYHKRSYPFDPNSADSKKRRSNQRPYTIDVRTSPNDTAESSPGPGFARRGMYLMPFITSASAPSRSPSPNQTPPSSGKNLNRKDLPDEIIDLETVDTRLDFSSSPSPNSSAATREDNQNLLNLDNSSSNPSPNQTAQSTIDNEPDNRWCNNDHFESVV